MKKFAGLVLAFTGGTIFLWLFWNLFIEKTEIFTKITKTAGLGSSAPYRGLIVFGLVVVLGILLVLEKNEQDGEEEENEFGS